MIFWIMLVLLVVLILFFIKTDNDLLLIFSAIAAILVVIMSVAIIVANVDGKAIMEVNKQRYDSLVYQAENHLYENDNDLGKKEFVSEIQKWNEDLAKGKAVQRDFWIGIFFANIYDEFEFIPMSILDEEQK